MASVAILVGLRAGVAELNDNPELTIDAVSAEPGAIVRVRVNSDARDKLSSGYPGTSFLQKRGASGQWFTTHYLFAGLPGEHGGAGPSIARWGRPIGFFPSQGDPPREEYIRIPGVPPGHYRVVKVLEIEDSDYLIASPNSTNVIADEIEITE